MDKRELTAEVEGLKLTFAGQRDRGRKTRSFVPPAMSSSCIVRRGDFDTVSPCHPDREKNKKRKVSKQFISPLVPCISAILLSTSPTTGGVDRTVKITLFSGNNLAAIWASNGPRNEENSSFSTSTTAAN